MRHDAHLWKGNHRVFDRRRHIGHAHWHYSKGQGTFNINYMLFNPTNYNGNLLKAMHNVNKLLIPCSFFSLFVVFLYHPLYFVSSFIYMLCVGLPRVTTLNKFSSQTSSCIEVCQFHLLQLHVGILSFIGVYTIFAQSHTFPLCELSCL